MERYVKLETIGRGSYAKVRKVKLSITGEIFAMKVVKKSLLKRRRQWSASEGRYKNAYDDVLREIALMKKLSHPNVIRMHEVVDDPEKDKLCIVLDFHLNGALMDTGGLPDEPQTPLELEDARRFFVDVVEGLTYLHFQDVVHFDLKPDNVLVSAERRGIIADFGVSRLLSDEPRTTAEEDQNDVLTSGSPGTPMFCAPEVWGDSKYYGKTADVWSLGVTLYVLLLGQVPYIAPTHEELTAAVCAPEPVPLPTALPEDAQLHDLLGRMLEKDPRRRIALADVATHPWLEAATPRGVSLRRRYSRITVNDEEIRAAVTIAGHADSFARDSAGRIVKHTRAAERDCYEAITRLDSALCAFVPPYHGELGNSKAVSALYLAPTSEQGSRFSRTSSVGGGSSVGGSSPPAARAGVGGLSLPTSARLQRPLLGAGPGREGEQEAEGAGVGHEASSPLVTARTDGRDVCVVLDDVTVDMAEPCLMDVKMGTRTFTESDISDTTARPDLLAKMLSIDKGAALPDELELGCITKLRYLKFRESLTTTQTLGFRVDAMKIGTDPNLNDTPLNFRRGPREPAAVLRELTRFVGAERALAAAFAAKLRALRTALEADEHFFPTHSLIRSSLLFTYDLHATRGPDGEESSGSELLCKVGVHMIDFSSSQRERMAERVTHREAWSPGNGEDGYLLGVDNLIRMFDKVHKSEVAWD
mmetsp:Transcript_34179/g.78739  ORF Transcript_34179/g.78739 Transcript_34179/m.78739 type:complete len:702 (+) Transcript_34179:152-2257(+)